MFTITDKQYIRMISVTELIKIHPFYEQRDIDQTRMKPLVRKYYKQMRDSNNIKLDTPIILLECIDFACLLVDKMDNRVNTVIVDGQHRVNALKLLHSKFKKLGEFRVPVFINKVTSLEEARSIQYDIFEQKPMTAYDRLRKKKYKVSEMMDKFKFEYQCKNKNIVKRYFVEGCYGDKGRKFRKHHFLPNELLSKIKNSENIEEWVKREVQCSELSNGLNELVNIKYSEFKAIMDINLRMDFVKIPRKGNFEVFERLLEEYKFQLIPYIYYKNYEKLVQDLEYSMELVEVELNDSSDDDDDDEDDEEYHDL